MTSTSASRSSAAAVPRIAAQVTTFLVAAAGTFLVASPGVMADPYASGGLLFALFGLGVVGLVAGTVAGLAEIDPDESGSGLFLALTGLLVGGLAASYVYAADRASQAALVALIGGIGLAFGYLIAIALAGPATESELV